jgi:hypothetical protein
MTSGPRPGSRTILTAISTPSSIAGPAVDVLVTHLDRERARGHLDLVQLARPMWTRPRSVLWTMSGSATLRATGNRVGRRQMRRRHPHRRAVTAYPYGSRSRLASRAPPTVVRRAHPTRGPARRNEARSWSGSETSVRG